MSIRVFDYPFTDPPFVSREPDGSYTMRFAVSGESLKLTGLGKTTLANIKKAINETIKEEKA